MTPVFHKPEEVAEIFQISRRTVVANASAGIWPCNKFGRKSYRFTDEHIAQIELLTRSAPKASTSTPNVHGLVTRNSPRKPRKQDSTPGKSVGKVVPDNTKTPTNEKGNTNV